MAITYNNTQSDCARIWRATSGGTVFSSDLATSTAFDLFTDTPAVDDAIYFSSSSTSIAHSDLTINVGTALVGTDVVLAWEYYGYTGSGTTLGWIPCHNLTDNTVGFTVTGSNKITFPLQRTHRAVAVNGYTAPYIRCRLVSFTTLTEGGRTQTTKVKTSNGQIAITGYDDTTPCTYTEIYDWIIANRPDISPTRVIYAGLTFRVFFFENCMLNLASTLRTTEEIVFLGNGSQGYNFYPSYIWSGTKAGTGYATPSHHFINSYNTGTSIISTNSNTKFYGGTLGKWGYSKSGFLASGLGEYVGVNFDGASGYITSATLTNCTFDGDILTSATITNDVTGAKILGQQRSLISSYSITGTSTWRDTIWAYQTDSMFAIIEQGDENTLTFVDPSPKFPDVTDFDFFRTSVDSTRNLTKLFYYDVSAGTYTDYTTQSSSSTANDIPLSGDVGDMYYFQNAGSITTRLQHAFYVELTAQANDYTYKWQYYAGADGWRDIPVKDKTLNFTRTGMIFIPYGYGITSTTVNGSTGNFVRLVITGKGTATPVATRIRSRNRGNCGKQTSLGGQVYFTGVTEKYTLALTVEDEDGNPLENATVVITDKDGNAVSGSPFTSDSNGLVSTTLTRRFYKFDPDNSTDTGTSDPYVGVTMFNPYTITVSKQGYETNKLEYMIDQKSIITMSLKTAIDVIATNKGAVIKANPENFGNDRDIGLMP